MTCPLVLLRKCFNTLLFGRKCNLGLVNLQLERGDIEGVEELLAQKPEPADDKYTGYPLLRNAIRTKDENLMKRMAKYDVSTGELYDIQTQCVEYGLDKAIDLLCGTKAWEKASSTTTVYRTKLSRREASSIIKKISMRYWLKLIPVI